MSMRAVVSLGFMVNGVLGNVCMMSMAQAFASDVPVVHEEHREMTMTPMLPLSPVHCEHCVTVQSSDNDPMQRQSGCAGHCFSQAHSIAAGAASFSVPSAASATPVPQLIEPATQILYATGPPARFPPTSIHVDTIVLTL